MEKRGEQKMNKADKKNIRTAKILFAVIFLLVVTGILLRMYNPQVTVDKDDILTEEIKNQISLELRNNRTETSDTVELSEMTGDDVVEKVYFVRINHDKDMDMLFRTDVLGATDGISEALKMEIYDATHEEMIYEGSLKDADNKVIAMPQTANGSKKNDTRYYIKLFFSAPVGDKYETSQAEVVFNWYVNEEDVEHLLTTKTGDLKVILYSFLGALALVIFILVVFRKHINPEAFGGAPKTEEADDEQETQELKEAEALEDGESKE